MIDDATLAAKIEASTAPRITPPWIDGVIKKTTFFNHGLLTICVLDLANGFTVTGESACASPENYRQDVGEKLAFDMARDKVWGLEAYLLKQSQYEHGI